MIIDIGGRNRLGHLRRILATDGTLVIVGGEGGNRITGGFGRPVRAAMVSPFVAQRFPFFISREHHRFLDRLAELMAAGEVVPAVGQSRPIVEIADAMSTFAEGRVEGKTAIIVS